MSVEFLGQGRNWRGQRILTSLTFKGSLTMAGMSPELLTEKLLWDPEREAESESFSHEAFSEYCSKEGECNHTGLRICPQGPYLLHVLC